MDESTKKGSEVDQIIPVGGPCSWTSVQALQKEYCPPLDDGLFLAISSEHDLHDPSSRQTLLNTLNALKVDAELQQHYSDFDPSGTGGATSTRDEGKSGESSSRSSPEESASNGVTSITTGLSDLKWDPTKDVGQDLDNLSFERKETRLQDMFPRIPAYEVSQILKSLKGDADRALDQLLSLSFLGNDVADDRGLASPIPRSIDGFAEDSSRDTKRKGRSKRKARTNESSRASSTASFEAGMSDGATNIWITNARDVDFICTRTALSPKAVTSTYHNQDRSLPATIKALVIKESSSFPGLAEINPLLVSHIIDLKSEFPTIAEPHLYGLLILSREIPSAAFELAEVMSSKADYELSGRLQGVAHYAPVDLAKENRPLATAATPMWEKIEYSSLQGSASTHANLAQTAFSQSSKFARLAKSDRHMGGAAAYYSAVGHEHAKKAKDANAHAANALVAARATATSIDLHGVSVPDAIRIARDRTEYWYESLGDSRYMSGGGGPVREGFRIVTGVGRHSKDGAPRIGPAVSKMLVREGWKVVVNQGEMMVFGKARR